MAYEILKRITNCEKEADEIIKKAEKNAQSIISEAKKDAENFIRLSKEKYNNKAKSLTDSVMTEISDEISVICVEAEKKIEALNKSFDTNHDSTVKFIAERILSDI